MTAIAEADGGGRAARDGLAGRLIAAALVIVTALLLVHGRLEGKAFLTDDYGWVARAGRIDSPAAVRDLVLAPRVTPLRTYRPLVVLSFAGSLALAGADPRAFLAHDLVLFGLAAFLVAALVARTVPAAGRTGTAIAAGLFCLLPSQMEVAAWSSARGDTLVVIFGFAALHLLTGPRPRIVPAALLVLLAALSKDTGFVFLAPLALAGFHDAARRAVGVLASLLVACCWLGLRALVFGWMALSIADLRPPDGAAGSFARLCTSVARLGMQVPPSRLDDLGPPAVLVALVLPLIGAGLAVSAWRHRRRFRAGPGLAVGLALVATLPLFLLARTQVVTPGFFNARMGFLALAGLLPLVAPALTHRVGRLAALAALAAAAPFALSHADAHRAGADELAGLHEALRAALARVDPDAAEVVILGFHEREFARGGFVASTLLEDALAPPFTSRRREIRLAAVAGRPVGPPLGVDLAAFLGARPDAAVIAVVPDGAGNEDLAVLLEGRAPGAPAGPLEPVRVPPGEVRGEGEARELVLGVRADEAVQARILAFGPHGVIFAGNLPLAPGARRGVVELRVPYGRDLAEIGAFAWTVAPAGGGAFGRIAVVAPRAIAGD